MTFDDAPIVPHTPVTLPIPEPGRRRNVLVLGWSRKVPAMLHELARYGDGGFEVHIVSSKPVAEREADIEAFGTMIADDLIGHTAHTSKDIRLLSALELDRYDHIVMIASEQIAGADLADASTAFIHQAISTRLAEADARPRFFVELLCDDDLFLYDRAREDVIVSPTIASYLVSQVALRRELAGVFGMLTKPWGSQIVLHRPSEWLPDGATTTRFEELEGIGATRGQIVLGVQIADGGLHLNPGRDAAWTLGDDDRIVTLATFEAIDESSAGAPVA